MKKNNEWLRNEINELPIMFAGFSVLKQREEFAVIKDDVLELIDQLDEPEVKQLEQAIIELETKYEDEIIQLERELKKSDNKIESLEYELFLEKTGGSKNSFYWFTAKKTPLVVDVSYLSYEDTLYGFKGVPNYQFIENHDLRFVTNCPLDDLIERYK